MVMFDSGGERNSGLIRGRSQVLLLWVRNVKFMTSMNVICKISESWLFQTAQDKSPSVQKSCQWIEIQRLGIFTMFLVVFWRHLCNIYAILSPRLSCVAIEHCRLKDVGNPFHDYMMDFVSWAVELYSEWLICQKDLLSQLSSLNGKRLLCHWNKNSPCHVDSIIVIGRSHRFPFLVLVQYDSARSTWIFRYVRTQWFSSSRGHHHDKRKI